MNQGICPKCDKHITDVESEEVSVSVGFSPRWRGISYYCPHCNAILGVSVNPHLMRDEIVARVTDALANMQGALERDITHRVVEEVKRLLR